MLERRNFDRIVTAAAVALTLGFGGCADDEEEPTAQSGSLDVYLQQVESPEQTIAVAWAQSSRGADFSGVPATYTGLPEGCTERTLTQTLLHPEVDGQTLNAGVIEITSGDETLTLQPEPDNRGGAFPTFGYPAQTQADIELSDSWSVDVGGGDDIGWAAADGTMPAAVEDLDVTIFDNERLVVDTSGSEPFSVSVTIEDPRSGEYKSIRCDDVSQTFDWNFGELVLQGAEVWREDTVELDVSPQVGTFHLIQAQPLRFGDSDKTQWLEVVAWQRIEDGNTRLSLDVMGARDFARQPNYDLSRCQTRAIPDISFDPILDAGDVSFTAGDATYMLDKDEFEYLGAGGTIPQPVDDWTVMASGGPDASSFAHSDVFGYIPDNVTIDVDAAAETITVGWSGTEPVDFGIVVDDGLTSQEHRCYDMTGGTYTWDRALDVSEQARVWVGTFERQPVMSWDETAINAVSWSSRTARAAN